MIMAHLRDFNASLNETKTTVDWSINASTIIATPSSIHPSVTQLSVIIKCAILIPVVFFGIIGNILTLMAIRSTPRLWTTTNAFLASLAVADVLVALTLAYYIAYQLLVYIFINPCIFIRMIAVVTPIQTFPLYVSVAHMGLLAADRFFAIVYPFHYERLVTTTVITISVTTVWIVPSLMSILQMLWLLRVDWSSCAAPYSVTVQFALTTAIYVTVSVIIVAAYSRIFRVVLAHLVKINAVTDVQRSVTVAEPSVCGPAPYGPALCDPGQVPQAIADRGSAGLHKPSKKSEFKAAQMIAVMLASFIVLWFPNVLGKALQVVGRRDAFTQFLIDIGIGLGSASNSTSWVIYGVMNRDFRSAVKRIFGMRN